MKTLKNTRSAGHKNRTKSQAGGSAAERKKNSNSTEIVTNVTSLTNIACTTSKIINCQNSCVTRATMQTKIRNCCTNTNKVTSRYNCSIVTGSIISTMNGSRLNITKIFVCKCQYLSVIFAKILMGMKKIEKNKTRKNQQTFKKCHMCNNTIKITLYCIITRKSAKGIKNITNSVDGQGPGKN